MYCQPQVHTVLPSTDTYLSFKRPIKSGILLITFLLSPQTFWTDGARGPDDNRMRFSSGEVQIRPSGEELRWSRSKPCSIIMIKAGEPVGIESKECTKRYRGLCMVRPTRADCA